MRLQKWLSQLGIASRREAEKWISEGRLAVNGKIVKELGTKVQPESDSVALDGKLLKTKIPPKVYWLLNKPDKILTARSDELTNKPTIYDLPMVGKAKFLVSPVGRLDFRTEGLLLLTNDGDLSYKLCRPEYHVPREYQVLLDGRLTKEEEQTIKKGFDLEDGPVRDVKITFVHGTNMGVSTGAWYIVTVHEGRNRLVRRLFEHFNKRVVRLIRVGFGDIRLPGDLPAGEYRQLTNDQVALLRKSTEKPVSAKPKKSSLGSRGKAYRKPLSQRPDQSQPAKSGLQSAAKPAPKNLAARRAPKPAEKSPSKPKARPSLKKPASKRPDPSKSGKPQTTGKPAKKPVGKRPAPKKPSTKRG
jgi:23S rRNA pseudouridine2605 synthase